MYNNPNPYCSTSKTIRAYNTHENSTINDDVYDSL